jgi:hypothetical protein
MYINMPPPSTELKESDQVDDRVIYGKDHEGNVRFIRSKSKSKVIPLQAWTGTEDSRRHRLPDFKTIGT